MEVLAPSRELFLSLDEETLLLTKVVDNLFDLAEANAAASRLEVIATNLTAVVERATSFLPAADRGQTTQCRIRLSPGIQGN